MSVISVDIDLRKVYAWHSESGMLCNGVEDIGALITGITLAPPTVVLVEIASAKDYHQLSGPGAAYNARRWTIYNVAMIAQLETGFPSLVLVCPSSVWTMGYPLKARHQLAKVDAKNKDLRECQAMAWSYRLRPENWRTLPDYLARL